MVSVTIGHGTSLMAPSIIRNTMTRPLMMRPVQRAGFEAGRVSVTMVMMVSVVLNGCSISRRTRGAETDRVNEKNFHHAGLVPGIHVAPLLFHSPPGRAFALA